MFGLVKWERRALEATYEDRVEVWRGLAGDVEGSAVTAVELRKVCEGRGAICMAAPRAAWQEAFYNRIEYECRLLAPPELDIRRGDILRVWRLGVSLCEYEPVGDAAMYPTHQALALRVRERA